jgi:hypothetical protein
VVELHVIVLGAYIAYVNRNADLLYSYIKLLSAHIQYSYMKLSSAHMIYGIHIWRYWVRKCYTVFIYEVIECAYDIRYSYMKVLSAQMLYSIHIWNYRVRKCYMVFIYEVVECAYAILYSYMKLSSAHMLYGIHIWSCRVRLCYTVFIFKKLRYWSAVLFPTICQRCRYCHILRKWKLVLKFNSRCLNVELSLRTVYVNINVNQLLKLNLINTDFWYCTIHDTRSIRFQ